MWNSDRDRNPCDLSSVECGARREALWQCTKRGGKRFMVPHHRRRGRQGWILPSNVPALPTSYAARSNSPSPKTKNRCCRTSIADWKIVGLTSPALRHWARSTSLNYTNQNRIQKATKFEIPVQRNQMFCPCLSDSQPADIPHAVIM